MRGISLAHGRMRWLALVPLLVALLLLSALAAASVDLLSGVRAYVGGESRWSKGQKDAVYHLQRYVVTRDPQDYRSFEEALAVPLGDRRARLALERHPPDLAEARSGFLQGGNHPADVDSLVTIFLRFRNVSFMAAAISIWAEADTRIDELATLGRRVREQVDAGEAGRAQLELLAAELPRLNAHLTVLEDRFSATLGEASRTVHRWVRIATWLLAGGLMLGSLWASWALLREQSKVEQALRESNERWTLAADAAGLGLYDWDLRTQRARVDARAAALYGLPAQPHELDSAGALAQSRVHPDDAARLRSVIAQAIVHPTPATMRYRVVLDDGSERHLESIAHVRDGGAGVGVRLVGTLRDVTAEVHAAQLRLDKEAAERASHAKSEFLSRVSHELRTPLNAVLGFSELLQSDTRQPLTPAQSDWVQHVIDAGRHLLSLIDDILDLSHLDDASPALDLQPVALAPLIGHTIAQLGPYAADHGVRLVADVPPQASLQVQAEPRRLGRVLHNLLTNAIKYNRRGGEARVHCRREGAHVCLEVCDDGPGLRADQLGQLFQPFNRLGAEFSKVPGNGLGLMVVQQLVRRLEGQLEVRSVEGEGTCMQVRLKASDAAQA